MKIESMRALFVELVKDLLHAEHQLAQAMPAVIDAARAPELKAALARHHDETTAQVDRLEAVFDDLGERAAMRKCRAMEGLIVEAEELLGDQMEPALRDAAITAIAQRIEHYEMAAYGAARTFAELIGEKQAAARLQASLDEEGRANKALTQLARDRLNPQALEV